MNEFWFFMAFVVVILVPIIFIGSQASVAVFLVAVLACLTVGVLTWSLAHKERQDQ